MDRACGFGLPSIFREIIQFEVDSGFGEVKSGGAVGLRTRQGVMGHGKCSESRQGNGNDQRENKGGYQGAAAPRVSNAQS